MILFKNSENPILSQHLEAHQIHLGYHTLIMEFFCFILNFCYFKKNCFASFVGMCEWLFVSSLIHDMRPVLGTLPPESSPFLRVFFCVSALRGLHFQRVFHGKKSNL